MRLCPAIRPFTGICGSRLSLWGSYETHDAECQTSTQEKKALESSTIALIVRYFNILLTVISAFFAMYGLIIIFGRKSRLNAFRGKMFLSAFCVAALLAFAVEAVCFNYRHYLKYFAGGEFYTTEASSQDPAVILTSDGVLAKITADKNGAGAFTASGVTFKNLDRRVTSVFISPVFKTGEQTDARIRWTDEESTREFTRTLYKALPHENHIAVQTCGKVSELTVIFPGRLFFDEISEIAVNRQIPFYFSGLRLFVVSMLFFAVMLFAYRPLRVKTAYYLLEYRFDPANRKQNVVYASLVILTLLFSWFCVYTSISETVTDTPMNHQYNRYLVDAFIAGRTNIEFGHPEKLLGAERPYDYHWLISNGYRLGVDWAWDIAYYKGKYYTYYGPVPAALLYLPYKLITGNYLSHQTGVFVFAVIGVVFLALLWRFLVKKYMPNARFAFYLLSFLTLFFVSHLSAAVRYPAIWLIVQIAGFAFAVAGTFLLLKSVDRENINYLKLFLACLCFALCVGCRANMLLISILVPAVLWKRRTWRLTLFVLTPYILVAIPLCFYNYVRFDSIFEFGQKYCTSLWNGTTVRLLNPLGGFHRVFVTAIHYLFRPYIYSLHFPFVGLIPPKGLTTSNLGFIWAYNSGGGLINFPILFCLLYLFKNVLRKDKPYGFYLSSVFFVVGAAMIILYSMVGIFHARYLLDCAVFFILPSLFCAYYWCGAEQSAVRLKIAYALLAASVFVGLFLFVTGVDHIDMHYYDPALYRYLEYSLGVIERF
jgi:hypothetical protein